MGRFINADAFASTGQGLLGNNMFVYCLNNPIRYCDPNGALSIKFIMMSGLLIVSVVPILITMPPPTVFTTAAPSFEIPVLVFEPPVRVETNITSAKTKGKENVLDTGLRDLPDDEISRRARDKKLPKSERQRYKREEKGRGDRNVQKRKAHYYVSLMLSGQELLY